MCTLKSISMHIYLARVSIDSSRLCRLDVDNESFLASQCKNGCGRSGDHDLTLADMKGETAQS